MPLQENGFHGQPTFLMLFMVFSLCTQSFFSFGEHNLTKTINEQTGSCIDVSHYFESLQTGKQIRNQSIRSESRDNKILPF